jgi:regulator of RNase E activity RraA
MTDPLNGTGTGNIIYCLESRLGIRGCFMTGVKPLIPGAGLTGRARTLRCLPPRTDLVRAQREGGRPSPQRAAIEGISPGEVLVIEARGELGAAVVGDLLAARVKALGGAGVVTDGCVRDLPGLQALGLPVFSAGVHASTFGNRHLAVAVDVPVCCGGVTVQPGDILVGDDEGVAVVPPELAAELAAMTKEQEDLDAFSLAKIAQGVPLSQAFPMDSAMRAEFDAQRKESE